METRLGVTPFNPSLLLTAVLLRTVWLEEKAGIKYGENGSFLYDLRYYSTLLI